MQGTSQQRHDWLELAKAQCAFLLTAKGASVPSDVRVSVGFPKGGRGHHAIGQCWAPTMSADKRHEIFISPELGLISDDKDEARRLTIDVLGVMAHELIHASVGVEAGHKGPFKRLALEIGLAGKMTATIPGDAFIAWADGTPLKVLGPYPAGKLAARDRPKKGSRLLKCECPDCGYVARVTRQWIDQAGAPMCPLDGSQFTCD